ncbi:hypothetical protein K438DRAFT_1990582 [Mycena galopus ATCC 62051]|nr:hypothetical protein K438DRAFT_1990582 [Mycena galopus ATCC 62051]
MRENEHGADFILSFGRTHIAGAMQVQTQYEIYLQAKKVKVVNGHEEVDFFYHYVVYKDNGVCIIPIHSLRQQMNLNNQNNRTVWAWANNRFQNPAADFLAGL